MSETKLYTTKELEEHIRSVYSRLEAAAREDGVLDAYEPLTVFFGNGVFEKHQSYCYAARSCYYFCSFGDRGGLYEQATRDLFEITCMVISYKISNMAMKYEHEHRIENQDTRRIRFEKELQYWNMLGPEYRKQRAKEIENSLFWAPYEDVPQDYSKKCSPEEEMADGCIGFFYDIAEESFERGAFKKAITYLTKCLKLEPQLPVYEKRGKLYKMLAEQTETLLKKKKYEKRAEKNFDTMKKLAMQTRKEKKKSYNKVAVMAAKAQISVMMAAESRKEDKKIHETLRNAERRSRIEQAILYFEENEYENALLEFNGIILFERNFATTGWLDFLAAHPDFESYQKFIGKTRMYQTFVRESLELKPDWKEVEGRGRVYEALAAQTEDEKQKNEYQKKAESDFAWARKLAGRNKITILIETCIKYVFSVLLSVSNITSYVAMLLSARHMIIANKPGKMRPTKG